MEFAGGEIGAGQKTVAEPQHVVRAEILIDAPVVLVGIIRADRIEERIWPSRRRRSEVGSIAVIFEKGLGNRIDTACRDVVAIAQKLPCVYRSTRGRKGVVEERHNLLL